MLLELSVENIAVIERAEIRLGPGFTVLTGETGAGKSLLVDAIALALGGRADGDLLRAGAQKGPVVLVADLRNNPQALALCEEFGLPLEGTVIHVQREISAEGRHVCRVGGRTQPVSVVKSLGATLVDLHGQHDHQALLDPERHVDYLDLWIGEPARALLSRVREEVEALEQLRARLNALRKGVRDREHRMDLLRFQVQEIESVSPAVGEVAELENQLSRLRNAEKLAATAYGALASLADEEGGALDRLHHAVGSLESASRMDDALVPLVETLRGALGALDDSVRQLRQYADGIESDPVLLEEGATRLDALKRLLRKYGESETAVLEFLETARRELAQLEEGEASEEELLMSVEAQEARVREACQALTELRLERATVFGAQVQSEIQELAMPKAQFAVSIEPKTPDVDGADAVQFLFSANPGEPMRGLAKIASGGEMSRVMLALKVVLAGKAGVPTLIFDEIDTGLSGRAAAVVARKLREISKFYQVVAISHLPQLAGQADVHFRISKQEREGRTFTEIVRLEDHERIEELARMLAGEEIGEMALANARELLAARAD